MEEHKRKLIGNKEKAEKKHKERKESRRKTISLIGTLNEKTNFNNTTSHLKDLKRKDEELKARKLKEEEFEKKTYSKSKSEVKIKKAVIQSTDFLKKILTLDKNRFSKPTGLQTVKKAYMQGCITERWPSVNKILNAKKEPLYPV